MTAADIVHFRLVLDPFLPAWLLGALGLILAVFLTRQFIQRRPGAGWRTLALAALFAALLNPWMVREEREPLNDVAVVAVDRSLSQSASGREKLTAETRQTLLAQLEKQENLTVREVMVEGNSETRLAPALREANRDIRAGRLAGTFVITDGQIQDDTPPEASAGAPVHSLIAGSREERDRRIIVEDAPRYAIVGQTVKLIATVRDDGPGASGPIPLTLRIDGETVDRREVTPGEAAGFRLPVERPGRRTVTLSVPEAEDEIAAVNNETGFVINGVRDRLRVLLVTGEPYPGARIWRDILKSDAAVDLVHFTILRPPLKQDFTPVQELALIAFPTHELFAEKLESFDLIIFDRYFWRGVLPLQYLANVVDYVRGGGALVMVAGPDFTTTRSLYATPLGQVLPAPPSGMLVQQAFRPELTDLGRRHPITGRLPGAGETPSWGPWYRQVDVRQAAGTTLMSGVGGRPLLVVERQQEGRVAQLMSDQAWLWARGHDGGGPQGALLRRLSHWLMKEPELEEEALRVESTPSGFEIRRRSLSAVGKGVTVTRPDGSEATIAFDNRQPGLGTASLAVSEPGLYHFRDGELSTVGVYGPLQSPELGPLRATAEKVDSFAGQTGGGIAWLGDAAMPEIRSIEAGGRTAGDGWMGLKRRGASVATGLDQQPLIPGWAYLVLIVGGLMMAWYREGRAG